METQTKADQFKAIAQILHGSISKQEILAGFKYIVDLINKLRGDMLKKSDLPAVMKKVEDLHGLRSQTNDAQLKAIKGGSEKQIAQMMKEAQTIVDAKLRDFEMNLRSMNEQKPMDHQRMMEEVATMIPEELDGIQIRNKLESLKGKFRLKPEAVQGLEELINEVAQIKARPLGSSVGGGRGIQLYTSGTKRGLASYLNIVAGTGISLAYASSYGRNDITISASGAGLSKLTATGAINDSNLAFTFASQPTLVVVNGAAYQENKGWAWDAGTLTATLDVAPGPQGDIYGLG